MSVAAERDPRAVLLPHRDRERQVGVGASMKPAFFAFGPCESLACSPRSEPSPGHHGGSINGFRFELIIFSVFFYLSDADVH